jgi:alpha-amylase
MYADSNKVLIEGEMEASFTEVEGILSYKRVNPSEQMLVIHNLTGKAKEFTLSEKESDFTDLYYKTNQDSEVDNEGEKVQIKMPSYSSIILKKNSR